ncbi:thioredoxin family protein [Streptomyces sp. NPDC002564]|uniref:thioredoxin family protein n=1 Tax=Streptomyces sp. NPDC002564 TaxID=3364649 RepID=UPI0036CBD070
MMKAAGVAEVTDADFAGEVLAEAERPVLVEFTADWCGPCRQLAPVLSELAREEAARLKIVQLDVDRSPQAAITYRVLSAPTMIVFRNGEPVLQLVGARAKRKLLADLADVL